MAKTFAIINVIIISFFLIDTYLIGPTQVQEIFSEIRTENSSAIRGAYQNDFIISVNGNEYEVPENMSVAMNAGDTFFVNISRICQRPLQIIFPEKGSYYEIDVGLINEKMIVKIMAGFILVISILSLTNLPVFKNSAHKDQLVFVSSFLVFVIAFFYFYQ